MRSVAPWSISGIRHRPETLAFCSVRSSQSRLCRPPVPLAPLPVRQRAGGVVLILLHHQPGHRKPLFKCQARCTAVLTPPFAAVPTNVEKANRE